MQDQRKQIVRDLFAAFNANQIEDLVGRLLAEDLAYRGPGRAGGADAWLTAWRETQVTFPGSQFEITTQTVDGDTVTSEFTFSGTHQGNLAGFEPTGKSFQVSGQSVTVFNGEQIVAIEESIDGAALFSQLGLSP
ncbi:MAG: ester cyclase [Anaerolineales bacterium]|nr:ester cyclase [Anaerolineales bacterium]